MIFLHALATKRKQLEDVGDVKGLLMNLPIVTVFEKPASPGGVWRSDINRDKGAKGSTPHGECQNQSSNQSTDTLTIMYEGLWINGHKDGMEFFDYTFDACYYEACK
jgi:cation diffusion facilitator CzcD-associated flavoprotein CzcO